MTDNPARDLKAVNNSHVPPDTLTDSQRDQLDRILEACSDLATVRDLAHEFSSIARERRGQGLAQAVFGSW
ncbi:hypothetical protein [Streptomyces sp. NPDC056255]|uniref:hypothetical protein n=1 Tax=Streptomyces sp. NPDC056255 TaxID=3345764 RepID=UPI0035DDA660